MAHEFICYLLRQLVFILLVLDNQHNKSQNKDCLLPLASWQNIIRDRKLRNVSFDRKACRLQFSMRHAANVKYTQPAFLRDNCGIDGGKFWFFYVHLCVTVLSSMDFCTSLSLETVPFIRFIRNLVLSNNNNNNNLYFPFLTVQIGSSIAV